MVTLHAEALETIRLINAHTTNQLIIQHPVVYANSSLKVISMNGQLVCTGKLKTASTSTSIDTRSLNKGVYLLVIESGIDRWVTEFYRE